MSEEVLGGSNRAPLVLKALMSGAEVRKGNDIWLLGRNDDNTLDLCNPAGDETGRKFLMRTHMSLSGFFEFCAELSNEEYIAAVNSGTLASVRGKGVK